MYARFFLPYFSCPFCRFSIIWYFYRFLSFSIHLHENDGLHCLCWSSGIYFYGLLAIQSKKIVKLLKKSERWPNKWSKVKTLEDQPRSAWPFFHKVCEKSYRNLAVSICLIIPQNREVKKFQLHNIDQSFEHNGKGISYQKKLESLEEEKAAHTSCKHGVRRIC